MAARLAAAAAKAERDAARMQENGGTDQGVNQRADFNWATSLVQPGSGYGSRPSTAPVVNPQRNHHRRAMELYADAMAAKAEQAAAAKIEEAVPTNKAPGDGQGFGWATTLYTTPKAALESENASVEATKTGGTNFGWATSFYRDDGRAQNRKGP